MDSLRTPEERFAEIPDYPYAPKYVEHDGLRLAYVDEGEGPIVVLVHGMPTWGFLWRKVLPPLLAAGYRVVVPDLLGFGRSDKLAKVEDYTYDLHSAALSAIVGEFPDEPLVFVHHDWGGPIGTRVAASMPERVAATVMMDTGFNTGDFKMSEAWQAFRDFVATAEELPIGFLIKGAVARGLEDDVFAAYEAPFPDESFKTGARAFPPLIPHDPDHPDAVAGRAALEVYANADWPKLVLWADKDPVLPRKLGDVLAERIGAEGAVEIADAGHFLQEDAGAQIGEIIAGWLDEKLPRG